MKSNFIQVELTCFYLFVLFQGRSGASRPTGTNWTNRNWHTRRKGQGNYTAFILLKKVSLIFQYCTDGTFITMQGIEGPRGPPGGRGVPGEGLPGLKVCWKLVKTKSHYKSLRIFYFSQLSTASIFRETKVYQESRALQERGALENLGQR